MRQRVINADDLSALKEMKRTGVSYQTLADRLGCGKKTVIDAINGRKPPRLVADNDNRPDRVTVMSPRNGGCSTTSGMMPVTLRRIPTIDGHARVAA